MKKEWMKKLIVFALIGVMILSLAACGSSDDSDSDSSTTSSLDTDEIMELVDDFLSDYTGTPEFFESDYESVDTTVMEGVKVLIMPYDATNDFATNIAEKEADILEALGADVFIYNADGTTDSWIQGINTAINEGYDAIDICGGCSLESLESQIEEAEDAGIYVQDTHNTDIHVEYNDDYTIGADLTLAGEIMAYEVIEEAGDPADVNCLVLADVGITADDYLNDGITSVFDEYGVDYTVKEVAITDWTSGIADATTTAFVADSSINAVISYYDNMLLYAIPAMEDLGLDFDSITVGSYNGSPSIMSYIEDGTVDFDLGESVAWTAFRGVDCMVRAFNDQEVYNTDGLAMYLIDSSNVEDCIDPDTGEGSYTYDGVTDVYIEGYSELWGIDVSSFISD